MDDTAAIERGNHAAAAKAELHRRVTERVERILADLISKHRSKGLSGDDAKAGVAAICEMRLLLEDVNRDIRQGEQARSTIMAPSPRDSADWRLNHGG